MTSAALMHVVKSDQTMVQDVDVRNAEGNTPLHWACLNGCLDVAKVLLHHGASPAILNRYNCLRLQLCHK